MRRLLVSITLKMTKLRIALYGATSKLSGAVRSSFINQKKLKSTLHFIWIRLRSSRLISKFLIGVAIFTVTLTIYPFIVSSVVFDDYDYINDRSICPVIYDKTGLWVGLLPNNLERDVTFADWPSPDHFTLQPDSVPTFFWAVLKQLEDRHLGTIRSYYGIDFIAFFRTILKDWVRGRFSGSSSIAMQVVRSMRHRSPGTGEGVAYKLNRKIYELLQAPAIYSKLGETGLKIWAATHVPLANAKSGSGFGGSIYGIELTSKICFGKSITKCTDAELAILAASFSKPMLMIPTDSGWTISESRFSYLKTRAIKGSTPLITDSVARQELSDQLKILKVPNVVIPENLRQLVSGKNMKRFLIFGHPIRRSLFLAKPELFEVRGELLKYSPNNFRPQAKSITLSTDAVENKQFKNKVDRIILEIWNNNSQSFFLPYNKTENEKEHARILIVAAEANSGIQYFYSNSQIPLLNPSSGRWLQVGSVGKVPMAIMFGYEGDKPNSKYYNLASHGFKNPGGNMGVASKNAPGSIYLAREVFSKSLNLPLLWRANRHTDSLAIYLSEQLGFSLPDDCRPSQSLIYGYATSTPADILNMFGVMTTKLYPRNGQIWNGANLISDIYDKGHHFKPESNIENTISALDIFLNQRESRQYVKEVLSSPLNPGGSLQRLCDWTCDRRSDLNLHIAKSGTVISESGDVVTLLTAGGIVFKSNQFRPDCYWSYLVVITGPKPSQPLGQSNLSVSELAPLVRTTLNQIYSYHNSKPSNYTSNRRLLQ